MDLSQYPSYHRVFEVSCFVACACKYHYGFKKPGFASWRTLNENGIQQQVFSLSWTLTAAEPAHVLPQPTDIISKTNMLFNMLCQTVKLLISVMTTCHGCTVPPITPLLRGDSDSLIPVRSEERSNICCRSLLPLLQMR